MKGIREKEINREQNTNFLNNTMFSNLNFHLSPVTLKEMCNDISSAYSLTWPKMPH
jgi:hypothetical protein